MLKHPIRNWKTSLGGVVFFLFVLFQQINAEIDGKVETKADWNNVAAAVSVLWVGLMARDHNVTSEQSGLHVYGN